MSLKEALRNRNTRNRNTLRLLASLVFAISTGCAPQQWVVSGPEQVYTNGPTSLTLQLDGDGLFGPPPDVDCNLTHPSFKEKLPKVSCFVGKRQLGGSHPLELRFEPQSDSPEGRYQVVISGGSRDRYSKEIPPVIINVIFDKTPPQIINLSQEGRPDKINGQVEDNLSPVNVQVSQCDQPENTQEVDVENENFIFSFSPQLGNNCFIFKPTDEAGNQGQSERITTNYQIETGVTVNFIKLPNSNQLLVYGELPEWLSQENIQASGEQKTWRLTNVFGIGGHFTCNVPDNNGIINQLEYDYVVSCALPREDKGTAEVYLTLTDPWGNEKTFIYQVPTDILPDVSGTEKLFVNLGRIISSFVLFFVFSGLSMTLINEFNRRRNRSLLEDYINGLLPEEELDKKQRKKIRKALQSARSYEKGFFSLRKKINEGKQRLGKLQEQIQEQRETSYQQRLRILIDFLSLGFIKPPTFLGNKDQTKKIEKKFEQFLSDFESFNNNLLEYLKAQLESIDLESLNSQIRQGTENENDIKGLLTTLCDKFFGFIEGQTEESIAFFLKDNKNQILNKFLELIYYWIGLHGGLYDENNKVREFFRSKLDVILNRIRRIYKFMEENSIEINGQKRLIERLTLKDIDYLAKKLINKKDEEGEYEEG